jgi:hypothetical protein
VSVVVGVTVKIPELDEAAEVETGDTGVVIVPFDTPVGDEVGEDGGVVISVPLVDGVVTISVDVVGELGGVVVVWLNETVGVTTTVSDIVGDVGLEISVLEVVVVTGDDGVTITEVVVGALEGVDIIEVITLRSDDNMLERIPPRPVLLVVAAADVAGGVVTGVTTPVEAGPVTPVEVGSGVVVGGRTALVTTEIMDERISVPTLVVVAAAEDADVVTVVDAAAGVVVLVGSRRLDKMLLRGKIPAKVEDAAVEVELDAAAVDPPVPEKVTPDVIAEVTSGLEELVVFPPVKIPPGPKVIPLAAADEEDGGSTVVAAAVSELERVGRITRGGRVPLEAAAEAEVDGSC